MPKSKEYFYVLSWNKYNKNLLSIFSMLSPWEQLSELIFPRVLKTNAFKFYFNHLGHIYICARDFSSHFSGNYDFHSFDNIIHDILSNEEFLLEQIHIEIIEDMVAYSA